MSIRARASPGTFSIGPVLTGVGLIVAGIGILLARRLPGALRFAPLAVVIYVFAVMIPVLIGSVGQQSKPRPSRSSMRNQGACKVAGTGAGVSVI